MNSEELEQSLRTEFESYLKDVLADMRQEFVQFQEKIESEFERHKSQLDEVFQDVSARVATEKEMDPAFKESIMEHLRLAKDEGARITATAIAEAEDMERASAVDPGVGMGKLRDATNDISSKTTQSSILKTLVHHAAEFTPRGAFFIIKNEHLVGWRVFGKEGNSDEQTVREVFFPVASSTVLGEAVRSLSAVESSYGTYDDDSIYLNKLEFGHPDQMLAIPLVVRGRSVAVLYADKGTNGEEVNIEALETLARVASLTVEILALARGAKVEEEEERSDESAGFEERARFEESAAFQESAVFEKREEEFEAVVEEEPIFEPVSEFREAPETSFTPQEFEMTPAEFAEDFTSKDSEPEIEFPVEEETQVEVESFEPVAEPLVSLDDLAAEPVSEFKFETSGTFEAPQNEFEVPQTEFEETPAFEVEETPEFEVAEFEPESFAPPADPFSAFEVENGKAESFAPEPAEAPREPAVAAPVKTRFSERNVDLPIEVGEEERRLHNDARRFARLLVSEIKLYNEQKVKEGREASDLYERLREAIDRSREMYDKRVQPPVAARFDYFHYEIVNTLAEGDEHKLGESYPGATV